MEKHMKSYRLLFICCLTLGLNWVAFSQGFGVIPKYDEPRVRNYSAPEKELREIVEADGKDRESAYKAWGKLLKALDDGYFISGETMKNVRKMWFSFNSDRKSRLEYLDELLKRIYDRPDIEIELRNERILFIDPMEEGELYDQENERLWQLTSKLRITSDFYEIGSTYRAGENALKRKDLDKADEYLSKVFHYKWFQFTYQPATNYFFEKYYFSIPLLISVKQNKMDVSGLRIMEKQLKPNVQQTYGPKIKEAIAGVENLQKLREGN